MESGQYQWKSGQSHFRSGQIISSSSQQLQPRLFPNTFTHFSGRRLLVATIRYTPLVLLTGRTFRHGNATCHEAQGSLIDLTAFLGAKLNFSCCFVLPPDGLFGNADARTGRVSGVVGMAARREVAFVLTGLSTSAGRAAVIDFSVPFMNSPSAALIRRQPQAPALFRVLAPLAGDAWGAVAAAVVAVAAAVTVLSHLSPLKRRSDATIWQQNAWSAF